MGKWIQQYPRSGRGLLCCVLAINAFIVAFVIDTPNAFGSTAQVWCSTTSGSPSTLSWTLSGTPTPGQTVTIKDFTISASMASTKHYDFTVSGASPSSFSLNSTAASTNFGDFPFTISGSSGSTFSVQITSLQTQVFLVMAGCPGTLGSLQGTTTFISQTISASTTTAPPTTTGATPTTTAQGSTNTTASSSSAASENSQPVMGSAGAVTAHTKDKSSAPATNKTDSKDDEFFWWLKSPWLWFSILLVLIPEYVRWNHHQRAKRRAEILDTIAEEEAKESTPEADEFPVKDPFGSDNSTATFVGVLDELKDLSRSK